MHPGHFGKCVKVLRNARKSTLDVGVIMYFLVDDLVGIFSTTEFKL